MSHLNTAPKTVSPVQAELVERIEWFIRLRWLAVLGLLVAAIFPTPVLGVVFPRTPLLITAAVLAIYNAALRLQARRILPRVAQTGAVRKVNLFANFQISVDLIILTALLHFAGGIENPFRCYYVFHMIIASILLERRAAFLQCTLASALLTTLALLERGNILVHVHLVGFTPTCLHDSGIFVFGALFVCITTFYLSVYMATAITERLRAKDKAIVAAQALAESRAEELAEANERLREADAAKSQLMVRLEHELRAPLSAIQSCLRVVLDGLTGPVADGARDMVQRAEKRTQSMIVLVNDLLHLAQARKGTPKAEMKPLDFVEAVERVCRDMAAEAERKKIAFAVDGQAGLSYVLASDSEIEELVTNLVSNAIKYSDAGASVAVATRNEGDRVLFEVADTGIGIAPEDQAQLFQEFFRARNAKVKEKTGTGLGLSIVQKIVESHGGTIGVESQLGKGSKFTVKLPLAERSS